MDRTKCFESYRTRRNIEPRITTQKKYIPLVKTSLEANITRFTQIMLTNTLMCCWYYLKTYSPNSVKIKTIFALPYKSSNYLWIIFTKDQDSEYDESSKLSDTKTTGKHRFWNFCKTCGLTDTSIMVDKQDNPITKQEVKWNRMVFRYRLMVYWRVFLVSFCM